MVEPNAEGTPTPRRKTPWSVLVAAALVFVSGAWMWNELRKDAAAVKAERETAAARASAAASGRPKILGLDVIPQEARKVATAAASASAAPPSSVAPSSTVAPSSAAPSSPPAPSGSVPPPRPAAPR